MKQIKAAPRVLTKYANKHKEPLRCSKCERKISENEYILATTHHVRYYCSECSRNLEI